MLRDKSCIYKPSNLPVTLFNNKTLPEFLVPCINVYFYTRTLTTNFQKDPKNMKYSRLLLATAIITLLSFSAKSQSLIGVAGLTISNGDITFDASVGEISFEKMENISTGEKWIFGTGVIQPTIKVSEPNADIIYDGLDYYPNPTRDKLYLNPKYDWITGYRLYKANGSLAQANTIYNNQINMASLAPGVYFLQLLPGYNSKYRTLKVIKQ
jgi:hypothetical protein